MATKQNPYDSTEEIPDWTDPGSLVGPPIDPSGGGSPAPSGPPTDPSQYNAYANQHPDFNPRDAVANDASSSIDAQLKAAGLDSLNDPSIKQSILANISYAGQDGKDPQDMINRIIAKNTLRLDNAPNSTYTSDGKGGYLTPPPAVALRSPNGGGTGIAQGGGTGFLLPSSDGGNGGGTQSMADIMAQLQKLFPDGGFNKDAMTRRVSDISDTLNRGRKSQMANNEAYLADRGLIGDGPQATAAGSLTDRLNQNYNSAVNDAYASESDLANTRMMQALQLATGMSTTQAQQAIDSFRANTEKELGLGGLALGNKNADNSFLLGQGNLALGNMNGINSYNLGKGQLDLGNATLTSNNHNANIQHIIDLLQQGMTLDEIAAAGYL